MNFTERAGVFIVRYDDATALSPASQKTLESALRTASATAPIGVVFVVSPSVRFVDREVPDYWIGVTEDGSVRIAAVAVVTPHPAVSVATRGFSAANILKNTAVAVKPFADEAAATAWVEAEVAAVRSKRAPGRTS